MFITILTSGPNPSKFDPGRFLDDNGQVVESDSLIPFSAGMFDMILLFVSSNVIRTL